MDFLKELLKNVQMVDDHDFNQENAEQNQGMKIEIPGLPAPGEGMPGGGEESDEDGKGKGGKGDSEIGDDEWDYFDSDDYSEDFDDIIDKLDRDLSNEDKNTLQKFVEDNENSDNEIEENDEYGPEGKGAGDPIGGEGQGNSAGNKWTFAKKLPIRKRKFESIITSWAKKRLTIDEVDVDQWAHVNRRFANISSDLELPYEIEMDDDTTEDDKIDVWFYQDTSGSCGPWKDRFFSIAESMPLEKFNMRMFCFDTNIYETSLESRELKGFGGTHFHILENHIQEEMKNNPAMKRYPEAIFVVTDGLGTDVKPEHPEKWHWILTPGGSRNCIPKACNIHDLEKYE